MRVPKFILFLLFFRSCCEKLTSSLEMVQNSAHEFYDGTNTVFTSYSFCAHCLFHYTSRYLILHAGHRHERPGRVDLFLLHARQLV